MDIPAEVVIAIISLAILVAVAWLELRYLRTKRQGKIDATLEQDDAYNSVSTAKAVSSSLKQSGRDTSEADLLIYQAQSAYERREYLNCVDLANRAKTCLHNSKPKDLLNAPVPPPETKKKVEEQAVPAVAAKKMPTNYLESKFIIETVECRLDGTCEDKRVEAEKALNEAKASFTEGEYTEALKRAMRAKRLVESEPRVDAAAKPVDKIKLDAPAPSVKEAVRCGKCGAEFSTEDAFCPSCGSKRGVRVCPSCAQEARPDDAFCRKCGTKLGP